MVPQRIEREILIEAPVDGRRDLAAPDVENQRHADDHGRGWELELGELRDYLRRRTGAPADR